MVGSKDRMRSHFEEDLESLVRQLGDGGRKARGFLFGLGGDPRRVLQAEVAGDIRRRDFTDAVADDPARDDPPRFPERRQGDLEDELDRPIHLGVTDPRGRLVGHQLGRWRPAEVATQDGVASLDRGPEDGLAPEQGAAGALPEAAQTGEYEDQSGMAPRELSPLDAAQVRLAAQEGIEGLDDLVPAGDDERQPVVVVPAPRTAV